MALSRFSVNLLFAGIVAALGLTAAASLYMNSSRPAVQVQASNTVESRESDSSGNSAAMIAQLQQMIAREPNNPDHLTQLGNIYYDLGQYGPASEYYEKSLSIRPHDPGVETDLATCFHYLGQHDKSLELLDRVLAYAPGFEQAKFNKGIVLIEGKKNVQSGISVWEELLRSNPGYRQRAELEQRISQLKGSAR